MREIFGGFCQFLHEDRSMNCRPLGQLISLEVSVDLTVTSCENLSVVSWSRHVKSRESRDVVTSRPGLGTTRAADCERSEAVERGQLGLVTR